MSSVKYEFRYMPLIGKLSGESMLQQTETAINEIAEIVNENTAQADIINTLAQDANDNSVEALEKANEALETSSRVYIHENLAVNLDSYCESQLIYVANISSTNLPIAKKGFLEVKTDDDKTECVQLFVSDDKDVYVRSGSITAETVGDITVYTADFEEWTSLSSPTILLQAGSGTSIPLSADLNDYNTEGTFYCSTTNVGSIAHCPVSEGEFKLIVMKFATANYGLQMLYPIGKHLYVRKYSGGAWGNWEVIVPKITSGVTNGSIAVNDTDVAVTGWNTKADLDSPVFVGTPTAPTPASSDNSTKLATTAFVQGNLADYAPLASPALTGNPTAPTQLASDNSTKIATTSFVHDNTDDKAPLASPALTGNPTAPTQETTDNSTKIATTAYVKGNLASYAPLASPAFTGTPTAPTPASSDNSTKLATTEFVNGDIKDNAFGITLPFYKAISDNTDLNDYKTEGVYRCTSGASAATLNNCPYQGTSNFVLLVMHGGSNNAYIRQTIYATSSLNNYVFIRNFDASFNNWSAWQRVSFKDEVDKMLPLDGSANMTGTIVTTSNVGMRKSDNNGSLNFYSGTAYQNGSFLILTSSGDTDAGKFYLQANNGTNNASLEGKYDGTLKWGGNNVLTTSNYNSYALPLSGGTLTGSITTSADPAIKLSSDNSYLAIDGATAYNRGAHIILNGKDRTNNNGSFHINAHDGTTVKSLKGSPDGTLTWGGNNVLTAANYNSYALPLSGGTMSGSIISVMENPTERIPLRIKYTGITSGVSPASNYRTGVLVKAEDKDDKFLSSIVTYFWSGSGQGLRLINSFGDDLKTLEFLIDINSSYSLRVTTDNVCNLGSGAYRWKQLFAGTATINTSDERLKDNIGAIPDDVLDAWGEVNWYQYQFKDSIAEKGETKARLHTGAIAQRIESVFESHGLDANRYGLLCYDEWDAVEEQKDEDGNVITEAREAGNRYSLRYEEALCMEAAYQRRRADRLEARIEALEKLLMNRTE